jgi:hypothetical protein
MRNGLSERGIPCTAISLNKRQSGRKKAKDLAISKAGSALLRWVLLEASWSALHHSKKERATSRAKAGGRDDQVDDPGRHPDSGPIADYREFQWWRPLDTGLVATSG